MPQKPRKKVFYAKPKGDPGGTEICLLMKKIVMYKDLSAPNGIKIRCEVSVKYFFIKRNVTP